MPYVNVAAGNGSNAIELYYEDHGSGKPIVLIHGFPFSGRMWERQIGTLLTAGFRVIAYDRRGFGKSDQPVTGYDYDTFAADLNVLMTQLDLRQVALVGFSMGGGEVARYIGKYGPDRVSKAVFIGAVPPMLLKTPDKPQGVPGDVFDGIKKSILADRPAFLTGLFENFFNLDLTRGKLISEPAIEAHWNIAIAASPVATYQCVDTWGTDFRADLPRVTIPTLVIHGDSDRIVPIEFSGNRTHAAIKGSRLSVIEGGPHGLTWTHADAVNRDLLAFL